MNDYYNDETLVNLKTKLESIEMDIEQNNYNKSLTKDFIELLTENDFEGENVNPDETCACEDGCLSNILSLNMPPRLNVEWIECNGPCSSW